MTTKPSPGALRAAKAIYRHYSTEPLWANSPMSRVEFEQVAYIIDRETGASDLLAALEEVAKVRRYAERIEETLRSAAQKEEFPTAIMAILPPIFRKAEIAEGTIAEYKGEPK